MRGAAALRIDHRIPSDLAFLCSPLFHGVVLRVCRPREPFRRVLRQLRQNFLHLALELRIVPSADHFGIVLDFDVRTHPDILGDSDVESDGSDILPVVAMNVDGKNPKTDLERETLVAARKGGLLPVMQREEALASRLRVRSRLVPADTAKRIVVVPGGTSAAGATPHLLLTDQTFCDHNWS